MANEVMGTLFGVTPEALMAERQKQDYTRAVQMAQLDPIQQAQAGFYMAGSQLGRGLGGLLGAEDPELMRVRQRQSLLQGVDLNDPVALREAASKALQLGDNAAASQLAQRALDVEAKKASIGKDVAATAASMMDKLTPEQRNAAASADTKADRGTPEWTKTYSEELARLTTKEGSKPTVVGVAEGTKQPVYSDGAQQFVYARGPDGTSIKQPYFGGVDRTTAKVSATATSGDKGRTAFSEQLGKLDAARVNDAQSARDNAVATLNSLNRLSSLDDQGLISGSFATGRVGATNLLATLGLASDTDQRRLASSENYQKVAGDVILGTLGGKLGAGFSNEDRKFIQSLVPQLENSPAARRQLIDFMTRKNQDIVAEATRLENYARDNEGLKGFQPKIPFKAVPASSMSAEELAKAAGGKIVNGVFVKDK